MGSQLSQSQQVRNVFPASQYKLLQSDKSFPDLIIFQKVSDSSNVALLVSDNQVTQQKNCFSPHVLKIIDRKKVGKSNLEIYQWANTHVNGLIEYITHIDKTRSLSKSQFCAILQGAVNGYSTISQQISINDCLHIEMRNLRIFHSISLKSDNQNRKQIVDYMNVKVVPLKISKNIKRDQSKLSNWKQIGSCIHKGGIHTERELLGHYMLQLSQYISKSNFKDIKDSIKNIKNIFGSKISKVIQSLLNNQSWKNVVQILDSSQVEDSLSLKLDSKEQLSSCLSNSKESVSTKRIETDKQISIQRVQSQKALFRCFEKQTALNEKKMSQINNPFKVTQKAKNEKVLNEKNMNICQKEMQVRKIKINQAQNDPLFFKSKSPQSTKFIPVQTIKKQQNIDSKKPQSEKVIQQIVSPQKIKIDQRDQKNCSPRLTRAKSILTIYPDFFRNQQESRSRIISTKILQNQFISPQKIKEKVQNFNSPSKQNINQLILKETVSPTQIKTVAFQRRKGKPISFQISQINPTLQPIQLPAYEVKTKPDINKNCEINRQQKTCNSSLRIR